MNCIDHPAAEAVGACGICGAGLCHDCFSGSMYTWDGKPLCPSCNVSLVRDLSAEAFRDAVFGVFRVAFYAGLWTLAIWQYRANDGDWFSLFFWGGIGAFPTAWRALRPSLGQAFVNDVALYGNGDLAPWYLSFWFRVFASFFLGALISPVFFVVALFQLVRALLRLRSFRRDLALMEEWGYPVRALANKEAPPDDRSTRKKAAMRRMAAYYGPWKRGAPAAGSPVPPPAAAKSGPAAAPGTERPETAEDRISARMAAVDARIAARKAAIESSKR